MPDRKEDLITVHTPDGSKYHQDLSPYGTTIPRAAEDGASRGFDPHKPGIVIIDPDIEGGNLEIDFSKLAEVEDFNTHTQRTMDGVVNPESAFQAFNAIAGELVDNEKKEASPTSLPPVSKKEPGGMNKLKLRKPTPTASSAGSDSSSEFATQESESLRVMLAEQSVLINQLTSQMAQLHTKKETDEKEASDGDELVATSEEDDLPPDGLGMPFLGLSAPLKPQKEIYFEMPQAGTMGARYHEVIESGNCIALVYDTRYEDGYQWIPPSLGDTKIKMTMPRDNKTYTCSSLGIHFHVGILDVVVLFKHDDGDVDKENYE